MRAALCALCVAALILLVPQSLAKEVPWHWTEKYAAAEYAHFDGNVYAIGHGSRRMTQFISYLSQETGAIDKRYMFVKCGVETRFLSPSQAEDLVMMEKVHFVKKGDYRYERYAKFYQQQCWSTVAWANRIYRLTSWLR